MKTKTNISAIRRGELTHQLMELGINKALKLDTLDSIKYKYTNIEDLIDTEMVIQAQAATEQVLNAYQSYVDKFGETNVTIVTEGWLHWKGDKGIADVYIMANEYIHILDLKTGESFKHYKPSNVQFLGYAAGLFNSNEGAEKVTISVIDGWNRKDGFYSREGILEWEQRNYEKIMERMALKIEDPLAYELLILMEEIKDRGIINKDILDVVHRMPTFKNNTFKEAGRRIEEEGANYDGYYYDYGTTTSIDTDELIDYANSKGTAADDVLKVMKAQKGLLHNVFSEEQINEMESKGIIKSVQSKNKSLKKN